MMDLGFMPQLAQALGDPAYQASELALSLRLIRHKNGGDGRGVFAVAHPG